jgi:cell fate regulator YaaT (PSP1 superfamily)
MAESRVDFRELVKKLAQEYQTRIEMRQIGSRDEAKLLGDLETCGQECCCKRFLKLLKPVNMRMAKMQKATLDPSKISGYCGRLKCCLRYEDETYTELKKRLPKKNTKVKTELGQGKVVDTQILTQLVMVEHEDGTKIAIPLDELEIISSTTTAKKGKKSESDNKKQDQAEDKESQ